MYESCNLGGESKEVQRDESLFGKISMVEKGLLMVGGCFVVWNGEVMSFFF